MEGIMNKNHEQPRIKEAKISATDFFRVVGPKDWRPNLSVGPFLPITSGGESSLPYNMTDTHSSTVVNYLQGITII
jgi:hypothetical protein